MTFIQTFIDFSGPVVGGFSNAFSSLSSKENLYNSDTKNKVSGLKALQVVLGFIIYIISLYILIKCERDTKNLVPVIIFSQLFPFIYVPYKLITGCNNLKN